MLQSVCIEEFMKVALLTAENHTFPGGKMIVRSEGQDLCHNVAISFACPLSENTPVAIKVRYFNDLNSDRNGAESRRFCYGTEQNISEPKIN
jgi:hypothetical protein